MTKTTNYEISKKLAEIGFKAETHFSWIEECNFFRIENKNWIENIGIGFKELFPAYDLETLLDALPEKTEIINSQLTNKREFYLVYGLRGSKIYVKIKENESLADTAGRLIILLHEKNFLKL